MPVHIPPPCTAFSTENMGLSKRSGEFTLASEVPFRMDSCYNADSADSNEFEPI